jgi:CRP/FNR family transcriptional regulator, cyclic AMP receptor protein
MRHKISVDDPLGHIPLFAHLTEDDRTAIHHLMTEVSIGAGQILAREGSHGHEFFVIVSGSASVDRGGVHVADVGPGDFQGEISLLDGGPRTATVTATTPMTLLVATHQEFSSLLDATPVIARRMLPALAHRVRTLATDAH